MHVSLISIDSFRLASVFKKVSFREKKKIIREREREKRKRNAYVQEAFSEAGKLKELGKKEGGKKKEIGRKERGNRKEGRKERGNRKEGKKEEIGRKERKRK